MSNVMSNGRSCEIDCLNSSLAPKSVPMADEGWRGRRRLDVWPSTDAVPAPPTELPPSPIRRPLHRHPHPQPRCHSLASTALTTTLTAALALAPSTWAPRRRRRRRGDVRSNNGPARMGNAEIGTVPDAPGPMDTGSVATEVGVRGNLRSTQLLFVVSGCGEPEGASWERESRSSDLSKVPRSSGNLRSWTCAHGPWEAGHSVDLCISRPLRSVIQSDLLSSPTLDPSTSAGLVDVDVDEGMFGRITDRRGWEMQRSALFLMPQDPWTRVQ